MDFLTEHWLSVGVGVFWLSMVLYGHYRGLVRIAVTMSALILSLIVTRVAMPGVTAALNNNTAIHQTIGQGLLHMAGVQGDAENEAEVQPSYQRDMIEKLKLPEQMKEVLLENNNSEIYQMLGVELNQIARLPILWELNQLAGALLGAVAGLLFIWLAGLVIKACSGMPWTQPLLMQIEASWWLSLLYQNNLFNWLFIRILTGFL